MRFVRVPPYESWANWTNFCNSWENGEFFGVKSVALSSTLKMRKSKKKLAPVYAYTPAYTRIRDGGGKSAPPPGLIGLIRSGGGFYLKVIPDVEGEVLGGGEVGVRERQRLCRSNRGPLFEVQQ